MKKVSYNKGKCTICHDKLAMSQTRCVLDSEQKRWGELCHRCYRSMRDSIMARALMYSDPSVSAVNSNDMAA